MIPYMVALCITKTETENSGRAVLTAVASVDKQRTLFATCKHAVRQQFDATVFDEKHGLVPLRNARVLVGSLADLDLAFMVLEIALPQERRIRINNEPIRGTVQLSHAQNIAMRTGEEVFKITTASVRPSPFKAVREQDMSFSTLHRAGDLERAHKSGFQTLYGVLEMLSVPGVSGSPLWDQTGAIRGMVCSGTTERHELQAADGIPRLIYLPIKKIMKEAQYVLRQVP